MPRGPRPSGSRRSSVDTMTTNTSTATDDVSWDDLGDTINMARRASMISATSPYLAAQSSGASVGSSGERSSSGGEGRGGSGRPSNHRLSQPLPTIYASGTSTREFATSSNSNILDDSGRSGHDIDVSDRSPGNNFGSSAAAAHNHRHQSPLSTSPDEEYDTTARRPVNFDNTRNNGRGNQATKLNHSARSSSDRDATSHLRDSNTSWDDLGDEIAMALKQSMMVDSSGGGAPSRENSADAGGIGSSSPPRSPPREQLNRQPQPERQQAAVSPADNKPWNCPACTFLNENPLHLVCAICGTAKVVSKLPPAELSSSINNGLNNSFTGSFTQGGLRRSHNRSGSSRQFQEDMHNSFSSRGDSRRGTRRTASLDYNRDEQEQFHSSFSSMRESTRGSRRRQQHQYDEGEQFASSFNSYHSHRRSSNAPIPSSYEDEGLRQSTGSRGSLRGPGGGGGGSRSQGRSGVRRGTHPPDERHDATLHRQSSRDAAFTDRGFNSSLRRSNGEQSLDSFGSFNSQNQQLHTFKPRGTDRRKTEDRKSLRRSASAGGGGVPSGSASVASMSSHRRNRSTMSQSTRHRDVGGGGRSVASSRSHRRSMSAMDHHHYSDNGYGAGGGYVPHSHRADRFDDDDFLSENEDERIGNRIGPGSVNTESDCSSISDDETHYRDDKTARTMRTVKTLRVPEGDVTIIYTDVQGSTSLWEADPLAMKKATDLHDSIIRKCYADHGGYEITTEGDAFNLAFQHPADAIGWALRAQLLLYRAKWPEGILNHPDGCDNEKKKFRGFRVRMGMHHGPTTSHVHDTTGRTIYQGEAVNIAKAIEKMSHGGQILTTVETWRAVSGMAEQFLGSPQVMDCGEHLLFDPKKKENPHSKKKERKRIFSKRIVQLVPNSLSYDFFAARGGQEVQEGETPPRVCGRVFPPLLSHGQLSTSFLNAPYIGNRVAMVFVYTDKMEAVSDKERKKNYKILAKYVRSHLMRLSPPGYECQEDKGSWMLAFDRIENGIKFGLDLKEDVINSAELFGDVDKERAFRIGIHWGPFLSMGPHTVSGHADYFGPIVNRAARVAAQCEPGQVCVGVPMGDDEEPPDPGPSVDVDVLGVKQLKGISIEMAIFACRKRKSKSAS